MEQQKYQALFYGELKAGHTKEMAMRALAGAYQKDDEFFESWFSGDETVVKKEASLEQAEYIRDYLGSLGLVIQIEPCAVSEKEAEALLEEAFSKIQQTFKDVQGESANKIVVRVQPALLGKRFVAYLLDLIICIIVANVLLELVIAPLGLINTAMFHELSLEVNNAVTQDDIKNIVNTYMANEVFLSSLMQVMMFSFAVQVLYFGLMDSKYEATLGKRLFRIKVYSLVSPQILLRQAALRQVFIIVAFFILSYFLGSIGLMIFMATFAMSIIDKRGLKQTLYDRLTATVVGVDQSKKQD